MATAPILVLLYDRTFVSGSFSASWRTRRGFYLALVSTWLLVGWLAIHSGNRGGTFELTDLRAWWRYDLTQCVAVIRYLGLAWWPQPLVFDYGTFWIDHPSTILVEATIVVGLLAATGMALWRWPVFGFLGCWFFGILAPSSVLPGTIQMIVEHRMYLSLAAVVVLIVALSYVIFGRKSLLSMGALAFALAVTSAARNQNYRSAIGLFEDTVAKRPGSARAMALLADYDRRAGRLEEARKWLEHSLALEPGVPQVLNNLGYVWQGLGEPAKAVDRFKRRWRSGRAMSE